MNNSCKIKNPLIRDGVSQTQRLLKALSPDYVKVDERSLSDLLWFADQYAKKIQYYNKDNFPDGDWQSLIENDISTTIASISQKDLSLVRNCLDNSIKNIEGASSLNNDVKTNFGNIFKQLFYLADEFNKWYEKSIVGYKLNTELKQIISAQLRNYLQKVIAYYKYADKNDLVSNGTVSDECLEVRYEDDFFQSNFNVIWILSNVGNSSTWHEYLDNIDEDETIYEDGTPSKLEKIKAAIKKIIPIIEKFIDAEARLINRSPGYLQETLDNWSSHEPHIALFLTFIQLFKIAQDDLNKITKRHLDFYYNDVLKIFKNEEVPNSVHLIFELAKQVDSSYLLEKDTQLKAGKDASEVEVFYNTDEDIVLNKAEVSQLKTVFIDYEDNGRIYSAPVANSKDGQGEEFDTDEPKWKTFGESQKDKSEDNRTMQFSEIGFAVTSPILFLNEGTRTIEISLTTTNDLSSISIISENLKFYLSAKDEWIKAKVETIDVDITKKELYFKLCLNPDSPSIIDFNSSGLTGGFNSDFPILKVLLNIDTDQSFVYANLKDLTIENISLKATVEGLRNLILQNDAGLLKSNKPFYPFGTNPGINSNFYVGSKEVFQKDLTYLKMHIEWKDVPDKNFKDHYSNYPSPSTLSGKGITLQKGNVSDKKTKANFYTSLVNSNSDFKISTFVLIDNEWKESSAGLKSLFDSSNAKSPNDIMYGSESAISTVFADYIPGLIEEDLSEYQVNTQRGFIKLVLSEPPEAFGHHIFRDAYTKKIISFSKTPAETDESEIPKEPYTPFINHISLDYIAKDTINVQASNEYSDDESKFYHIYPFGTAKVREVSPTTIDLIPKFYSVIEDSGNADNEGELYIGISNLEPPQNLSLLFQVAEGSADPELPKQEVIWAYLSANKWIEFNKTEVISDSTNGLIKSGIIVFDIPKSVNNDNTLLPSGYHWLRASVTKNSAAICDTLDIAAQAVKATYNNNGNDPDFLSNPLSAGSIKKLKNKDSNIKSVSQPYSSFDGKTRETDDLYYTRVSEKLRHKNRGITIWDYEKLILQEFPSIYKVKCINHSTYIPKTSEFAPGFVSVIVIPSLLNKNAVNPLEPRASIGTLNDIEEYLKELITPFAAETIKVLNPLYEKVKVNFEVEFLKGCDRGYYTAKLENDIIEFLSPWAFKTGKEISFGGKIQKSVIINFVEERDYVDFVTEFKMYKIPDEEPLNEAVPTTSRSILVSSDEHEINEVTKCK